LKNGGRWEAIRLAIEPHEDGEYSDLYRQVVFRSLGTEEKTINAESARILSESLTSSKIFLNKYAFQPGHRTAIFKIFEKAGESYLFKPWLICHYHISFCELSLPFPAAKNYRMDRIVKISNPLIGRHPIQSLPTKFDIKGVEQLLDEKIICKQKFRLFHTWDWMEKEIMSKVDPTGMKFIKANLPFMLRRDSDKKIKTAAKKMMNANALEFGVDIESGAAKKWMSAASELIVAQCVYCYQLREESLPSDNGVVSRY
jgi:hypothetical protein